ncbi:hypothetical protein EV426DRAFT_581474 [Tirmania nivea]|nr:hypothetical protein EV426DRAFT_581474 [Tirmania nivea]
MYQLVSGEILRAGKEGEKLLMKHSISRRVSKEAMTSYKRVLKAFGRTISDADCICNVQVHPWDIKLEKHKTGEKPQTVRWEGNIQLIGYIDTIFLISYQGTARFQEGIVIYKDEKDSHLMVKDQVIKAPGDVQKDNAQETLQKTHSEDKTTKKKEKVKPEIEMPFDLDSLYFIVNGWGHEIGPRTTLPYARKYTLYIRQVTAHATVQKALRKHSAIDLFIDTAQIGVVAAAEAAGHLVGKANTRVMETANEKFKEGISTKREQAIAHSASRD